jgi:tRNA modification GTPase
MVPVKSAADSVDTIVAQATANGRGGVGIIRVSGKLSGTIAEKILRKIPKPRMAEHLAFWDQNQNLIDKGIALFFKGPNSFTGEDVLELQGHGGPFVLKQILQETVRLGARLANPGEFSLRAFLNNKMDLLQAEAVAELINASSEQAAKSAARSLQGDFSQYVNKWIEALIRLRMFIEASIDFPEEEIDFLNDAKIDLQLKDLLNDLHRVNQVANQGALLAEGLRIAIAGKPNAGKSSFLNRLSGLDSAIVTDIPGTTRDLLKENIAIDGLPIQLIDTAGLRQTQDEIESEGIKRACREIHDADHVLWIMDGTEANDSKAERFCPDPEQLFSEWGLTLCSKKKYTLVVNKVDLLNQKARVEERPNYHCLYLSAKTGEGMDLLREHLKKIAGFSLNGSENIFIARARHLDALKQAEDHLKIALVELEKNHAELLAEELRLAQLALEEITGRFSSDDLLGKIFSEFCIGK